jgi:hypothetical protein
LAGRDPGFRFPTRKSRFASGRDRENQPRFRGIRDFGICPHPKSPGSRLTLTLQVGTTEPRAGTARDDTSTAATQPPPRYAGSVAPSALRLAVWPCRTTLDGGPCAPSGAMPRRSCTHWQPPSPHCWPLRLICGAHCTGQVPPAAGTPGPSVDSEALNRSPRHTARPATAPVSTNKRAAGNSDRSLHGRAVHFNRIFETEATHEIEVRTSGRKDSYGGNEDREPGRSLERRIGELRVRVVRVHNKRVGAHPVRPNAAENLNGIVDEKGVPRAFVSPYLRIRSQFGKAHLVCAAGVERQRGGVAGWRGGGGGGGG